MAVWHRCSVRTRLSAVAGLVMALICATATVLVLVSAQARAVEYRKAQVIANALPIVERVALTGVPSSLPEKPGRAIQLFSPARRLVASTRNLPGTAPMADLPPESTSTTRKMCDLPAFPGQCKIVLNIPIHMANGTWRLYVAGPLPPWYGNGTLLGLLLGGSLLLVAVTAAGAYWIVGRTLAPVRAISGKLATITASDLGQRVPVPKFRDELRDLAQTANETLDRAQAAVEQQLRFASDASHDLRTPLAAMRVEIEEAHMYAEETNWPEKCHVLLESVARLQDLVTDLLQIARLDSGMTGRRERLDLTELVACELGRRPRRITLIGRLTPGVMIDGERIALARLLTNLLDNAERHARSAVTVGLDRAGGAAVLEVVDDGEGVAPDQREVVFQRFARLEASRRKDTGGTGLGLSIARQIAESHGGTLTIEDSDSGARFVVRVPCAGAPPEGRQAEYA
ncbi:sensor histidine kinase [Microtetraspora niveoalba]|uniref:sensor histidine kinase n=1 Tax=Microtetraspora niveoalba TaxID=46175 RepID=UPI000A5F02B3|nr:HAMP domain-containing sensor histidine kinase [Microtetraspora niveoalba]